MRGRYRFAYLLAAGLYLPAGAMAAARGGQSEISGNPSSSDQDLNSPFSITAGFYGYPGYIFPGVASFSYTIPDVTNPTSTAITAQVYFSTNQQLDENGRFASTQAVAITGCTITFPPTGPDSSVTLNGSCTVTPADNVKLVSGSSRVLNPNNTSQGMVWGLGAEANQLQFGNNDTNPPDVELDITPTGLTFVVNAGASTPISQTYTLPKFLSNFSCTDDVTTTCSTTTLITASQLAWLSAQIDSADSPTTLTVTVSPSGLPAAIYTGEIPLTNNNVITMLPITLTVLPATAEYIQQGAKLTYPNSLGSASQGTSVSLSKDGSLALVGGPKDAGGGTYGAAWSYLFNAGAGNEIDQFWTHTIPVGLGQSVALSADGSVLLAGGPLAGSGFGDAWVAGGPCPAATLVGAGATGNPGQGAAVALSGGGLTALVGGPADNTNAGAVWVFTCTDGAWTQQSNQKLVGTAVGKAQQGASVALSTDGNTAIFGGPGDNGGVGAAWVFTRSGSTWTQQTKLAPSNPTGAAGVGSAVALSADGNTALVGGSNDASGKGAAWIFTRSGSTWTQSQSPNKLVGSGAVAGTNLGTSVALSADGSTAAIGGAGDSGSVGAAWIFRNTGGVWNQVGKLSGSDRIGASKQNTVALSGNGNIVLLGGPADNSGQGAAWGFVQSGPAPTITSINPTQVGVGGPEFTLTVNGANFLNGATVQWNGAPLPTTFLSATQLIATVSAGLIAAAGAFPIYAVNPDGTPTGAATLTVAVPQLSIVKSHTGNFAFGENGATYSVTVSNAAGAPGANGTVTVTDTVPTGMTLLSMSGQGWTCPAHGNTCTINTTLPAGQSYSKISVAVKIASNATSPIVNQVSVSGGGSANASTTNSAALVTASACDANVDLTTDVHDVQQLVNETLGAAPAYHDLNGDGKVTVADVQIVANAVLFHSCS